VEFKVTTFNQYKSELLRWARRKDQLLTVVGALVIFCAFLAKEVYGDRARRAGESLEVAAMNYQTQSELIVINDTAHRIELAVDEVRDMAEHSPSSFKKDRARLKDAVDNLIFVLGGQVNILKQLRSKLPHDQDRGCSDERIANLDALVEKAAQMNGEDNDPEGAEIFLGGKNEQQIKPCAVAVFAAASQVWEDAEKRKFWTTHLSYWFFAIGWGLTLLGKLAKKEEIAGIPES
jgi:Rad3-related DNA helicase